MLFRSHVKEHHLATLERCDTAKKAWEQLETVYQAKSNTRKRQLRKELTQLKMGAAEPLTKYVSRAKELQDQLRGAGHEVTDQEVAWYVLAGLPPAYDTVVTVLETTTDKDTSIDEMLPKLMQVGQRQDKSKEHVDGVALAANKRHGDFKRTHDKRGETRTCYMCGRVGHIAKDCPEKRGNHHRGGYSAIAL